MAFWNKTDILRDAVADWQDRGLIDASLAETLQGDIGTAKPGFAFTNILALLAIICIAFAAVTFVAANWEDMTRVARLVLLGAGLWGFWIAAIVLRGYGLNWFAEVCVLGACALFGASIMMISQMYHIQGEPADAVWMWAVGTLLAAGLARSIPALCLAVILFSMWPFFADNLWRSSYRADYTFLAWMAACSGLAYWMQSRFTAHLIAISLCIWVGMEAVRLTERDLVDAFMMLTLGAFTLVSGLLWSDGSKRYLRGFEKAALFYALGLTAVLILTWHFGLKDVSVVDFMTTRGVFWLGLLAPAACAILAAVGRQGGNSNLYDLVVAAIAAVIVWVITSFFAGWFAVTEALMLALSIWVVRMGWRLEYRPLAALGFLGFGIVMLVIYFETLGTLLGTSVFYLVAGVVLLAGVIIVPRLTRKVSS